MIGSTFTTASPCRIRYRSVVIDPPCRHACSLGADQ
jgi:hypothetical protein